MGKRKIEIEEIKDRQKRSVTFTKRRDGLFKKAETASQIFGGLQIGILVFSPAGKPFTFCCNSSSSSVSVDEIIDAYMSSSTCTTSSSSSAVVMGKRRSRSDEDVQVIETEKKKKQKTMNAVFTPPPPPPPPCISTVEEEEEGEKLLDEGWFHWDDDHYKMNLDSDQTQELRNNEFSSSMGYGENNEGIVVTGEMIEGESSSHSWAPEIINVEDDDDHHHDPPQTTTTTTTSLCNSMSAANSDVNEDEEVGGAYEDDDGFGFTLEEWDNIFNTSPPPTSTVVEEGSSNSSTTFSSCLNQDVNWPTQDQEFLHLLCS